MTDSGPGPLRTGWRFLLAAPDRILVPTLVLSVPAIALHIALQYLISARIAGTTACGRRYLGQLLVAECGPSSGRAQLGVLVGLFVIFLLGHLVVAGINRAALDAVDGLPVRGPFAGWGVLRVLPTATLLAASLTVATLFFLLPGLVLAFFTRYAMLFLVDRPSGPVAAISASVRLVAAQLRTEVGFATRSFGLLVVGALALGIGLYAAVPVVLLGQVVRYRAVRPITPAG